MIKVKHICYISLIIFLFTSIFFQIKNFNNDKIGKSMSHINEASLQVVKNWNDYGIVNLRFNQFFPWHGGKETEMISKEQNETYKKFIFNCINLFYMFCPQEDGRFGKLPYVSYPALGNIPLFFMQKTFPDKSLKQLNKLLLIFYYLFSSLLLSKIIYDFIKKNLKFDKNLKYILSLGVFLKFYLDNFLFVQFTTLWINETIETLFIVFVLYSRYLIHHKVNKKNLYLYSISLLLFSFHNYLAYAYMFFDFLITITFVKKDIFVYIKTIILTGLASLITNISLLYYGMQGFSSLKKIFLRGSHINEIDKFKNESVLDIFLNSIILAKPLKLLILSGFIIILVNFFFRNILKSKTMTVILPFYLTFFLFLLVFKQYHLSHDFFVIKFHILAIISIIPFLVVYKRIYEKYKSEILDSIIKIKNYLLLTFFYFYFYLEIKQLLIL